MIEIKDRNNYLEIIDSREIDNLKTSFYPKKDTIFNVFYLPVEEHEPVEGGREAEPIEVAVPDPVVIGNIEIKKTFGSFVIKVEDFVNENVLIDGRATDFTACVDFLTINTAV